MNAVTAREILDRDAWNAIVADFDNADLRQGYEWGEVRAALGWTPWRIAAYDGARCVGAVCVLHKCLPGFGWMLLHAPGGPLLHNDKDTDPLECLLGRVAQFRAGSQGILLRLSPRVSNENHQLRETLTHQGFRHLPDDWTTWNTPRIIMRTTLLEDEGTLKARLRRRYREHIAAAPRRGVTVRAAGSPAEAETFRTALARSGRRKGFPVQGRAYFARLWQEYLRPGLGVLLLAEHEGRTIGGLLGARIGSTAYMLYLTLGAAHDGQDRHQGPLLYWEFIRWARRNGCVEVDWGGTGTHLPPREDDPGFGLYRFKLGFNASVDYLTGYYDLVYSPARYTAFRFCERTLSSAAWNFRAWLNGRL